MVNNCQLEFINTIQCSEYSQSLGLNSASCMQVATILPSSLNILNIMINPMHTCEVIIMASHR